MAKLDQAQITTAALEIVETDGAELTLSAIARRLDVTQPALYYHLAGIDDVLRWVGIAVRQELTADLATATIGRARSDAVRSVAQAWRNFGTRRPAAYKSTDWYPVHGDADLEAAVDGVLAVLAGSLRSFDLDDSERANAALALRSTLHGFTSFEIGAGNPSPQSPDTSFDLVIELLITGVHSLEAKADSTSS